MTNSSLPAGRTIMDEAEQLLAALQLGDSFFPSGAFAYSSGLETFVADGIVSDREQLVAFVRSCLAGLISRCDLIFVKLSHRAAVKGEMDEIVRLDRLMHGMKLSKEPAEASMQMGRQMLNVASIVFPASMVPCLSELLRGRRIMGHHPVVFGAVFGGIGVAAESSLLTYLYSVVSALVGAGVRLIPLGHSDGQLAIGGLRPVVARLAREAMGLEEDCISTFAPGLEIRAMRHEHLSTRLFRS